MPLDPKLRDVLDFLPCEPCLERPSPDQEVLCSICHRLNRTVALKCQVSLVSPETAAPSEAELEAAREEARQKQEEFEALRAQQEADEGALERLQAERDELLARQRELEDRLAALEAQSHGGKLTFVEEEPAAVDEVVEFARVDLGSPRDLGEEDEDIMEFESMGSTGSAFGEPEEDAWDETAWDEPAEWETPAPATGPSWEEDEAETAWEEGSATHPADGTERVAWDEGEALPYGEEEEAPWETVDEPTDWSGAHAEQEGRAHAETPTPEDHPELDEQTREDLSELEAQLQELERELAKKKAESEEDEA